MYPHQHFHTCTYRCIYMHTLLEQYTLSEHMYRTMGACLCLHCMLWWLIVFNICLSLHHVITAETSSCSFSSITTKFSFNREYQFIHNCVFAFNSRVVAYRISACHLTWCWRVSIVWLGQFIHNFTIISSSLYQCIFDKVLDYYIRITSQITQYNFQIHIQLRWVFLFLGQGTP